MDSYRVAGIMSGTSLDGVDMALCTFHNDKGKWNFKVEHAKTIPYNNEWKQTLANLQNKSAEEFAFTHVRYGTYLGELAKEFLESRDVDFISSHGHTVFHQPARQFTFQIGDGAALSVASGLPIVCDFRSADIALKGQGAPLVPIGDKLLFGEYEYCLNLGGIANVSLTHDPSPKERGEKKVLAFDVCPCNLVLNFLANQSGKSYDENGEMAEKGTVNKSLLNQLNDLNYYKRNIPKSLGREDVEKNFLPILDASSLSINDRLATFCEHIALQIALVVNSQNNTKAKLLASGGGAYNWHLIERIKSHSKTTVIVPDKMIVEFKEAIIFAFLGVLRWRGEINCLKSVTGAERNSVGGAIYNP